MSTKSHFILLSDQSIEGYKEHLEPQYRMGTFIGYNAYLFIDRSVIREVFTKGGNFIITLNNNPIPEISVIGNAILQFQLDDEIAVIKLDGSHHHTPRIIEFLKKYDD